MTDPLIDEDGRCKRTDLLPRECGCAAHRGGEVVDLTETGRGVYPRSGETAWNERDLTQLDVRRVRTAEYVSARASACGHPIALRDTIGLIVDVAGQSVGWGCERCTMSVMENGEIEEE